MDMNMSDDHSMLRILRHFGGLIGFLLGFLVTMAASAEESEVYRFGVAGVLKADVSPVLYLCEPATPCVSEVITSIALNALPNTIDYRWEDLPDVAAGVGTSYSLVWEHSGVVYVYSWPQETRTPQSLIAAIAHRVTTTPLNLALGATFPPIGTTVHGLTSDPTGATATFTMWGRAATPLLSAVAATCPTVTAHNDDTWSLTCQHTWLATETDEACPDCRGRFTITLPAGEIVGSPPSPNDLRIVIHR